MSGAIGCSPRCQQDPLDSGCPARAGRRRAAEQLHQTVVAATAADSRLRAERVRGELEDRPRVVVKAAHERGVELIGLAGVIEQAAHLCEVLGILGGEPVKQRRRVAHRRPRRAI